MRPGSVIVDLAVERGGNVRMAKPGEIVTTENGVKIVGHLNVPGRIAATASSLYARNLFAFVETLIDKTTKTLGDQLGRRTRQGDLLTRDGAIVHPNFQPQLSGTALRRAECRGLRYDWRQTWLNERPQQLLEQAQAAAEAARASGRGGADLCRPARRNAPAQPPMRRPAARSIPSSSASRSSCSPSSSAITSSGR